MSSRYLADAGPLVALLNRKERHHAWVASHVRRLPAPLFTCEAVLSEAFHLLEETTTGTEGLLALMERGYLTVDFGIETELSAVARLMRRYRDVPMSYADACLVRMAEVNESATVFTLDSDFVIYRKNGRHVVPTLMPPSA